MSVGDYRDRIEDKLDQFWQAVDDRTRILGAAIKEMPADPRRVSHWVVEHFIELLSDWVALSSSVYYASLPTVLATFWPFIAYELFGLTEPEWYSMLYFHAQAITAVALIAILGIYAVRTWNRIRNLLSSPFESDAPNLDSEVDSTERDTQSIEENRRKKYRYCLWGILIHISSLRFIIWLEDQGYAPTEITFPLSIPAIAEPFTKEMGSSVWFVDGVNRLAGSLTLGESLILLWGLLIPAGLIGYGIQLHIQQVKRKTEYDTAEYGIEIAKSIWVVLFVLILLNQ